jgi:hypothetical protein
MSDLKIGKKEAYQMIPVFSCESKYLMQMVMKSRKVSVGPRIILDNFNEPLAPFGNLKF